MKDTLPDRQADALCEAAAQVLRCADAPADEAKQAFRQAYLRVVQARNAQLARRQNVLVRLNALLSHMSSVEFPLVGLHRDRFDLIVREIDALVAGEDARTDAQTAPPDGTAAPGARSG